ncbi:hypothetical protein KY359_00515 [Candidatus Woesearchaeota archaeon]|nr:hypothetical protein [Candidatus Woesearchaeota archaeon]
MMKVRHGIGILFVVFLALFAAGCAQQMTCAPPNVMVGDTCCLDADDNSVCDTWEEAAEEEEPELVYSSAENAAETEEEVDAYENFAETFAQTWDRKSYTALHNLFVKDLRMKYSSQEFNFLARKIDAKLGTGSVSLVGVEGDTAEYKVMVDGKSQKFFADIDDESGGLKHEAFYFFEELTADSACGEDDECYFSYAKISGDRNYCDKAGELRVSCVEMFGVSKDITAKIDNCLEITEYYSRSDCLTQLAVDENNIEPCWEAGQDKQVFECMGEVAAAREDVGDCKAFIASRGYPGTRLQHTYCVLGYVRETADTDACAEIDRRGDIMLGAMQEGCYKLSFP